ncbi:DUF938 domain-containing protein [Roseofilum reptotaenium CS-1145]|uniref:SAM-dependent methyltransferase n=1 Tax=Roseofilum reptotaenium AO1-A TaxID=1925591 RepID=A0A1L9QPW6_9CYAN|nr:DUF938 domain-containing protein [Roseofilum reptotaenium]MDB9517483.1 DUF938 domain-containing protein [Roseofilum reptotaenium CS-1145]OJJ24725.1 SAM-dependent methyltransferase [Roseofilum reptotaenium AO1-A]
MTADLRQYAPATQRNREPILEVLQRVLPPTGTVLEVASGTGEHAVFFAPHLQPRSWLPSEFNPQLLESIKAWQKVYPCDFLYSPIRLDSQNIPWNLDSHEAEITAIVCINMIHISPWEVCLGLMAGAEQVLPSQGILYLYGPYKQKGEHTAPSNASFDQSLRFSNPLWGVRNLEDVIEVAQAHDLHHLETIEMPANNLSVVFEKGIGNRE